MTIPERFDPRTASRADYDKAKADLVLTDIRQRMAPQAGAAAPELVRTGRSEQPWEAKKPDAAAVTSTTPAPAAPASGDLDALRAADAVAIANRADREIRERSSNVAQVDARTASPADYAAALAQTVPSYRRRT